MLVKDGEFLKKVDLGEIDNEILRISFWDVRSGMFITFLRQSTSYQ